MTRHSSSEGDSFPVCTGVELPDAWNQEGRAADLGSAVEGLRSIRKLTNLNVPEPAAVPAEWERLKLLRAVSLLLEAEGLPPSAVNQAGERVRTGYCAEWGDQPGQVRVRWLGSPGSGARYQEQDELRTCAQALRAWGFLALEVRGPGGRRHLEVEAVV